MKVFFLVAKQNDLFFDDDVSKSLGRLLRMYTGHGFLDFESDVDIAARKKSDDIGPSSIRPHPFFSFYQHLISNYSNVSFGNPVYTAYVVMVMNMRYPSRYRRVLFEELGFSIMRSFSGPSSDPASDASALCLYPLHEFLFPLEEDLDVLQLYAVNVLGFPKVAEFRDRGSLYRILVHHVATFLFHSASAQAGRMSFHGQIILEQILKQPLYPQQVLRDLLFYSPSGTDTITLPPRETDEHSSIKTNPRAVVCLRWFATNVRNENIRHRAESILSNVIETVLQ